MTMKNRALLSEANKAAPIEGLGTEVNRTPNCLKAVYDFAVLGGVIGSINLLDDEGNPAILPAKAVIKSVYVDVITDPTSLGMATVSLDAVGAADLLAATAIASITAQLDGKQDGTAAKMVKCATAKQITATVAVADLTDGKFNVFIEYGLSD